MKPGIYNDIENSSYHAGPGISKTGLWTIYTQSPAHYKYGQREDTQAFDFGQACHLAILQPDEFETIVYRGPEDRRGNKWKDAVEYCNISNKLLLTSGDYDEVLAIRDVVHADTWINNIITQGERLIEVSGYFTDEKTGELCRIRPDLYRKDLGLILDVKTTTSAHPDDFARSVINYGYHAQEAFYTDGMTTFGETINGFAFIVFEKKPPYAYAIYELPPSIVEEGRAIIRKSLDIYHECQETGKWPAYPSGVQELKFNRWAYKETTAPDGEE